MNEDKWDDALEGFLCRYKDGTRSLYGLSLRLFKEWCDEHNLLPLEAVRVDLDRYARWLDEVKNYKPATQYQRLSVIRNFYRIAYADRLIDFNPALVMRMPKVPYDQSKTVGPSRGECLSIIAASKSNASDHALVMLLLGLGLRVSEVCSLDVGDLNGVVRGHRVLSLVGKGGRPASIPIPPMISRVLDDFVGDRTEGPLFVRRDGNRLERRTAYAWVKRIGRKAGVDDLFPHALRHAAITTALDSGASLRDAQVFARHADVRMTSRYDNNRINLDRHPAYSVLSYLSA